MDYCKQQRRTVSLEELLRVLLYETGYYDYCSGLPVGKQRISNLRMLVEKAATFEESNYTGLYGFLSYIDAMKKNNLSMGEAKTIGENENVVRIMTVHKSKGLEFPVVYLAGMEDGLFPSFMTIASDDPLEIEEERRLAYVVITRAKEDLTLTCAKSRMLRGETQYNPESRFVREIPKELLDNTLPPGRRYRDDDLEDFQA